MLAKKTTIAGVVAAATAVLVILTAGPAHTADEVKPPSVPSPTEPDESLASDRAGGPTKPSLPGAASALTTIQTRIASYVDTHAPGYTFASYVDETSGKMILETDAPASLVAQLTDMSSGSAAEKQAVVQMSVQPNATSDNFHRRDDIQPFWGGGGITAQNRICSSGYAVRKSSGTVFMTTAGHCFSTGVTVLTESRARTYGVVSDRHLPTWNGRPRDVELIGGRTYAGRIFTGGVTSTTSAPVVSAGTAYVGYSNYCHSGRTTGERCGHTATSITGQVCTQTGCKFPVIVFRGGVLPQLGDSGSPFYAKDTAGGVWIRGHVIAGSSTTSYAERWTSIAPLLGVTIVRG